MSSVERQPADQAHRERIAIEFDSTLFVEAGAGTGKTHALVTRIVEMIGSGHLDDMRALAAITFTEAAASELRDRVRVRLEQAVRDDGADATRLDRWRHALESIDEASISTLHGFAQRLLSEFPLEAGLPPGFEVVDPIQAGIQFEERWEVFVDELFDDAELEPVLLRAFSMGARLDHLRAVALTLHQHWDRLHRPARSLPPPGGIDASALLGALDAGLQLLPDCEPTDRYAAYVEAEVRPFVEHLRIAAERAAGADDGAATRDLLQLLLHDTPKLTTGNGKRSGPSVEMKEHFKAAEEVHRSLLADLRREVLTPLVDRVVTFTLDGVRHREKEGRLEFHDLLVLARRLLRDATVRTELTQRFAAILVDEFQDTDPLQVEIAVMLALADPGTAPAHWTDAELARGRLFLVGDPKQSIYRFRRADIAVYESAKASLSDGLVPLTTNFRSRPGVIEWVNAVFAELIRAEPGAQPEFEALVAHRQEVELGPAVRVLGGPHDLRVGEVREVEAAEIAAAIVKLKTDGQTVLDERTGEERPLEYADVALLLPTRTSLTILERALDQAGVPYRVESRSLVFGSDEVRELLAILQAVENPSDEVAIVAALRSAGFACSDVDLVEYKRAGGRWSYPAEVPDGLDDTHPAVAGLRRLQGFHDQVPWRPVNELVDEIIRGCRLAELTIGRHRPRDHWRRYRLLLDEARAFVDAGGQSLGDFVAWVQLQADEQATRMETIVPETDDDAVRILTVHGAKGLEFPVVVLAGLNTAPAFRSPPVLWNGDQLEVRIGTAKASFETSGYAEQAARERKLFELEQKRLLYVAATRARDVLYVSLHHKDGSRCAAADLCALLDHAPHTRWEVDTTSASSAARSASTAAAPATAVPDLAAEAARWRAERADLLRAARRPTAVAPTTLAHSVERPVPEPEQLPPARRGRAGTSVGRAVHGVLQLVDLDAPDALDQLATLAHHQAVAEGVPDRVEVVEALARSALRSAPVAAAVTSGRRWRELFVGAPVGETIVEGYIDLLYENAAGDLVVVDYKTDQARTDAELDDAMQRYRLQGAAYALALEQVVERSVAEVAFVFCRPGDAVVRTIDDLSRAREEVLAGIAALGDDAPDDAPDVTVRPG